MNTETLQPLPERRHRWLPMLMSATTLAHRLCRRKEVFDADAEDFASWARLRLMDNDHAILRKFRGDCAAETFLAAVVANLFRDYQNHRWGKWRPSAAARRKGALALALETAVYRDGLGLRSAVHQLTAARFPDLTVLRAAELLRELPRRERRTFVEDSSLDRIPAQTRADQPMEEAERTRAFERFTQALGFALDELEAEDRAIIELRFWEGLTVADVARALNLPQKPLYRRIPRILAALRASPHLTGLEGYEEME
ncbi:MAG: sigma-70 family RNA polymerase sigma factor [Gemmatimonadota bacterium]